MHAWAERGMLQTAYLARHRDEGVGLCGRLEGNKEWRCVMSSDLWALGKWRARAEWRGGLQSRSGLACDRLYDGCEVSVLWNRLCCGIVTDHSCAKLHFPPTENSLGCEGHPANDMWAVTHQRMHCGAASYCTMTEWALTLRYLGRPR